MRWVSSSNGRFLLKSDITIQIRMLPPLLYLQLPYVPSGAGRRDKRQDKNGLQLHHTLSQYTLYNTQLLQGLISNQTVRFPLRGTTNDERETRRCRRCAPIPRAAPASPSSRSWGRPPRPARPPRASTTPASPRRCWISAAPPSRPAPCTSPAASSASTVSVVSLPARGAVVRCRLIGGRGGGRPWLRPQPKVVAPPAVSVAVAVRAAAEAVAGIRRGGCRDCQCGESCDRSRWCCGVEITVLKAVDPAAKN